MRLVFAATAVLALSISGCGSDETAPTGSASAKPSATAKSSASAKPSATASAAPSASAAAATDDPCKAHELSLGGKGTMAEKCKYDKDVLTVKYTGKVEDDGASFDVTNPWKEDINWLSVAVFYYDKSGKQLSVKHDGADKKDDYQDGIDVKLPGGKTTTIKLGFPKKELPKDVDTIEVQVISFGWDLGEGKGAYFESTEKYKEDRAKGGGGAAPAASASASAGPAASAAPKAK